MSKTRFLLMIGLAILLRSLEAGAQTGQQPPERPPASDFNIQILNFMGPSYMASVPGAGVRSGVWSSSGTLHRTTGWQPTKAVPAEVSALKIQFWLEDGAVRLEVIAYMGKSAPYSRPPDWEKLDNVTVASRQLTVDHLINITETERYGIEPFSVKVSRAEPWSIGPPEIVNKTQALTVTRVAEERPAYRLTVRNVSHKTITGITWYGITKERSVGGSSMTGGRVIGAGRLFDIHARFNFPEARPEVVEAEFEPSPKRAIVIAAVVFEDGTFEGEADKAAEMAAGIAGHRTQYLRGIELWRGLSLVPDDDQSAKLSKLKQDIESLSEVADQEVVNELVTRYASASEDMRNRRIKELVSNALKSKKRHLLQLIETFEYQRSQSLNDVDFKLWLKRTIEMLERSAGSN